MEKNKDRSEGSIEDAIYLAIIGLVAFFLVSLPLNSFLESLKFLFVYYALFYLPFILLVDKISSIGLTEKFLLIILAGLVYSGAYVYLDVFLKIPLTKLLFVLVSLMILISGLAIYFLKSKIWQ